MIIINYSLIKSKFKKINLLFIVEVLMFLIFIEQFFFMKSQNKLNLILFLLKLDIYRDIFLLIML